MFDDLVGRTAVVTGGARGIGYALAEALAGQGVRVALADVAPTADSAERLAGSTGTATAGVQVDVTDPESVAAMVAQASERLGPVDICVNAAGIGPRLPALEMTLAEWNTTLAVNLTGTFLSCQAFARACVHEHRPGTIVNIASMSGRVVNVPQQQSAYNVSKAGVEALTSSLGVEWLPLGIRVNAISPGYILSEMTRAVVESEPELAAAWRSRIPAGDLGRPADLGALVVYLASSASSYLIGQSIVIDGGYTLV